MRTDSYDVAQVCVNGHVITSALEMMPQLGKKFCNKCGAPTIAACQICGQPIQGMYHGGVIDVRAFKPPSFCHNCGKPFPWIASKLSAARELADELAPLTEEERDQLKKSLDDLVQDTPRSPVAVIRFKKLAAKAGAAAASALRDIMVDVVSETAKKAIWG